MAAWRDERPDRFWPWDWLDIDEWRWSEYERARRAEVGSWWPFLIGGLAGLLLALLSA